MNTIRVVCPVRFPDKDWSESEVLGSMVWLWHHDTLRQDATLPEIIGFLMPPIKLRQFILFYDADRPIGYISWANFNASTESLYRQSHFNLLENEQYWNCGDRTWIIDYFAPFGDHKKIFNLSRKIFPRSVVRFLKHKELQSKENKVFLHRGIDVSRAEMYSWDRKYPLGIEIE
ncbi:toxin-activating lysine-acyltransferase [Pasteurella atlantica]|uniref:toxin-activating lysine-acyltransferase n=1 Tax=Pasteurellaceae TaxID=712 RepID=UPI002761FEA9|nr:toxin-activating lysine-acyltransferase [Pasteurella atlantica]MDP8034510.1 toxin-activating lysine-acyltransferase [Pasteurella atlantica]MDP8036470.1 toxin-activating lysine-acyltransferase [Pasteurella atlantica]MDP8038395.1 toxin-activating lysine-acyltransferase [Pasteurella atlantica]MDP8048747.1 toxin-activating lysine-acyltransferase [Pasteurella atlantica]MDP8050704.1 toxin-activating lysine-acyltransferase [Pasteurella atlantica]